VTVTDYKRLTTLRAHSLSNACFLLDANVAHFTFTIKGGMRTYILREQHRLHHLI